MSSGLAGDHAAEVHAVGSPKVRRDPEFFIAVGALVVSALAMLSSVLQVGFQRSQERAMVWPHVSARPVYTSAGFAFRAENKGLGPALVRHMRIEYDGKAVANWSQMLDQALGPDHGYGWDRIAVNDVADAILAANSQKTLFSIPWDSTTRAAFSDGGKIKVQLCYCSVLNDCWISSPGLDHQSVDHCPRASD